MGINFAWQNNAHIINNSWKNHIVEPTIDNAIQNAVTNGRGGLGTIVVFASGNGSDNSIFYPSNNPNVIAVGATNRLDNRASFSNYGPGLDVVAPGVEIYTTDRQGIAGSNTNSGAAGDYHPNFTGTSASAPQIAGIAALILSMNPTLTNQQVRNLIESTTDRVGPYTYTLGAGEQPTLMWNNQMGYGRVNALNAMKAVYPVSGPETLCNSTLGSYNVQNLPTGFIVTNWSVAPTQLFSPPFSGTSQTANVTGTSDAFSSGQATITFVIETDCGEVEVQHSFWVGRPSLPDSIIWGSTSPTVGSYEMYLVSGGIPDGATSMTWWLPYCFGCSDPWSIYSGQNLIQMVAIVGDSPGYVQAMGNNTCGNGPASLLYVVPDVGGGSCNPCPFIYPNPASDELFVEWRFEEALRTLDETDEFEVALYDMQGARLFSRKSTSALLRLDLSKLRNGFYYIHILHKEGLIRKQIRVER